MYFRRDIQGLRGIAVLFVLFYHLYPDKMSGGFIGVDIFFAISGYLICSSIEAKIKQQSYIFFINFYASRMRRLLPSSFSVILLLTIYIYINDRQYFALFRIDAISCIIIYANYHFYYKKVDYFNSGLKESPLLHYWSLSLEEQFYIVSPIVVFLFYNQIRFIYLFFMLISFSSCIIYGYLDRNRSYFFLSTRAWEFISGTIMRFIPYNILHSLNFEDHNIVIMILTIIAFYYNDDFLYPSYNAIAPLLLCLKILYSNKFNSFLTSNNFYFLGTLSYVIYLIHYPLKYTTINSLHYYIILVTLSLILHNFVEYPFYKGIFIITNTQTIILSIFILMMLIAILNILNINIIKYSHNINKYSSSQLIAEIRNNLRMYCCIDNELHVHKSSIFFIGDSHIEQYIIALFYTKYSQKFQFIHVFVSSRMYTTYITELILKYIRKYSKNIVCTIIGNYIKQNQKNYNSIINIANSISVIYKSVIISNDNPYHTIDPNSCSKKLESCYGVVNKTCYIPKYFNHKKLNSNIKIVKLWTDNIVKNQKCLYYYNAKLPIYADNNHFSLFYLKYLRERIVQIIISNTRSSYNYIYNNKCKYYHLPSIKYNCPNLDNETCI